MMRLLIVPALLCSFLALPASSAETKPGPLVIDETVHSPEEPDERFRVSYSQEMNEVKVVQESPGARPGAVKIRILRKNKRPLEVKLKLMEPKEDLFHYTGKASPWTGSIVGFELEWSFDKKTWKKLKKLLP